MANSLATRTSPSDTHASGWSIKRPRASSRWPSPRTTVGRGAGLLAIYSLGLGIPFLLAALAIGPFLGFITRFKKHFALVEKIVGVLLIATGIAFLTGGMQDFSYWLLQTFPGLANLG